MRAHARCLCLYPLLCFVPYKRVYWLMRAFVCMPGELACACLCMLAYACAYVSVCRHMGGCSFADVLSLAVRMLTPVLGVNTHATICVRATLVCLCSCVYMLVCDRSHSRLTTLALTMYLATSAP